MPNIYVIITIVGASLVKGITGFGFALLALPILLHWYSPVAIIPVLMICNLVASLFILLQKKEHRLIDKSSMGLIVAGGVFTSAGVVVLRSAKSSPLIHLLGGLFIILTLLSMVKNKRKEAPIIAPYLYLVAGAVIGFITGAISISGPPLALFLNRARVDNEHFREIFAWFSTVTAIVAIIVYIHMDMMPIRVLKEAAMYAPILLLGTVVGKRLNYRLSPRAFSCINLVLSLVSSVLLLR